MTDSTRYCCWNYHQFLLLNLKHSFPYFASFANINLSPFRLPARNAMGNTAIFMGNTASDVIRPEYLLTYL